MCCLYLCRFVGFRGVSATPTPQISWPGIKPPLLYFACYAPLMHKTTFALFRLLCPSYAQNPTGIIYMLTPACCAFVKVAVNTIIPRSPFFCCCTSKPKLLHTSEKTRSNISVNEMALFVLFPTCVKGKTFVDTHGERGGLPTRRDSGPTRYGCAPH